jgi:hypothetical protein
MKTAEVAKDLRLERCLKRILNPAPTRTSMGQSRGTGQSDSGFPKVLRPARETST